MTTSARQFNLELQSEHLDEAAFLYLQRLAYLHDPEVKWPDLAGWEERLDAHLDAIVVGGQLALDICLRRATEGDHAERHVALRVFCRHRRKEDAFSVLDALDPADDDLVQAASNALRSDAPAAWRDDLVQRFEARPALAPVLASVIGYRRFPAEAALLRSLATGPALGTTEIAWALGRVGSQDSVPALSALLDSDKEDTVEAAALALLRLSDDNPLKRAVVEAPDRAWARRILGIAGGPPGVRVLVDRLKIGSPDVDTVRSLGLLGDLAAVPPLLSLLDDDGVGAAAAVALNTITGAELNGRTFVADRFDVDELTPEERASYDRDGTVPTRNGAPYGNWEDGPVRDPDSWGRWLDSHKSSFNREYRWRLGRPHGPGALLDSLRDARATYATRAASYEELVARYGMEVPFETVLPVRQQFRFLQEMSRWEAQTASQRQQDGGWWFANRPQR